MPDTYTNTQLSNYEAVSKIYYITGITSPSQIMDECKRRDIPISRKTIYNIIQKFKKDNEAWVNTTASTGYLHTVKNIVQSKKERLEFLESKMRAAKSDHAVAKLAHEITDTEDSLRLLLENIPLLMRFKQLNENATIRE